MPPENEPKEMPWANASPDIQLIHILNALVNFANEGTVRSIAEMQQQLNRPSSVSISGTSTDSRTPFQLVRDKFEPVPLSAQCKAILEAVVRNIRQYTAHANRAVDLGGTQGLDAALEPGTKRKTVQVRTLIHEYEGLASILEVCIKLPNPTLSQHVDILKKLNGEVRTIVNELHAVCMSGFPAPAQEPSRRDDPPAEPVQTPHADPAIESLASPVYAMSMCCGQIAMAVAKIEPEMQRQAARDECSADTSERLRYEAIARAQWTQLESATANATVAAPATFAFVRSHALKPVGWDSTANKVVRACADAIKRAMGVPWGFVRSSEWKQHCLALQGLSGELRAIPDVIVNRPASHRGWTQAQIRKETRCSEKTFARIREDAGVETGGSGKKNHVYSEDDLKKLADASKLRTPQVSTDFIHGVRKLLGIER